MFYPHNPIPPLPATDQPITHALNIQAFRRPHRMGSSDNRAAAQPEDAKQTALDTFQKARAQCEVLFYANSSKSTSRAIAKWEAASVKILPHVGHAMWMDFQRELIAALESKNLSDAASKVRKHMWDNAPDDEVLDGTASPSRMSDDRPRDSIGAVPNSPPQIYEVELDRMVRCSRAETFGPHGPPSRLTRPSFDERAITAPPDVQSSSVEGSTAVGQNTRPTGYTQRASTVPPPRTVSPPITVPTGSDVPRTDQDQQKYFGWSETIHNLFGRH